MKTLGEIKQLMAAGDAVAADAELKELLAKEPNNQQAKMLYGTCRQPKKWFLSIVAIFISLVTQADIAPGPGFPEFSDDISVLIAFLACSVIVMLISVRKKSPWAPVWLACLSSSFLGIAVVMLQLTSFYGIFIVGLISWIIATLRLAVKKNFIGAVFLIFMMPILFLMASYMTGILRPWMERYTRSPRDEPQIETTAKNFIRSEEDAAVTK